MDRTTISIERDPIYQQQIWLTSSAGGRVSVSAEVGPQAADDEESGWARALRRARAELGLRPGDQVVIVPSDPSLQPYPWELLGGPAGDVSVVRRLLTPGEGGATQVPRPLRLLSALPDAASAVLRAAVDLLQRQGAISLDLIAPALLGSYLAQPGYYHIAHVATDAPCLASAEALNRQCGRGRLSLLVVHSQGRPFPWPTLVEAQAPGLVALDLPAEEAGTGRFLARFYADLSAGICLETAVLHTRTGLDLAGRCGPLLFTSRPEGDIWPLPHQAPVPLAGETPSPPAVTSSGATTASLVGLIAGGSVQVAGDVVMGPKTQTVHQVGGDMVAITRQSAVPQGGRPSPRFCAACGAQVEADHSFCQACGHRLGAG